MLLWSLALLVALLAIFEAWGIGGPAIDALVSGRERARVLQVALKLQEASEVLSSGLVLAESQWKSLKELASPWGTLVSQGLDELRSRGAPLLPTLRRFHELAREHHASLLEARAKSSQALAQAAACAVMVPLFGAALYLLLPGLSGHRLAWMGACSGALFLSGAGALWMLRLADRARWLGLAPERRHWALAAQVAGERFLALLRAGNPPDLAWGMTCERLATEAPDLAIRWGHSLWRSESSQESGPGGNAGVYEVCAELIVGCGGRLRKALQASVMEGRPCAERAETELAALRRELAARRDQELALVATRALVPLFSCVAPALLGLLAYALWLSWQGAA